MAKLPARDDGAPAPRATAAAQLKPYSNTCGLLALPRAEMANLEAYRTAIEAVAAKTAPAYD